MPRISHSCNRLVIPLGFSKGWVELAPKKPPPFCPPSLMASWLATGPPGIVWVWPATVVTAREEWKLSMTPWLMKTMAATNANGTRTRTQVRIRSTQKLPNVRVLRRTRPRMSATATAAPAAADTKLWKAKPVIWLRLLITPSP